MALGADTAPAGPMEELARSFHPFAPELRDDPYPYYRRLREEAPIAWSDVSSGFWILSKYDDIRHVLQNPEIFSNRENVVPPHSSPEGPDIPTQLDPPEHTRYRALLQSAFSPGRMQALEGEIRATANRLIDAILAKGRCDFLADYSVPLPCETFCRIMGVPMDDLDKFLAWKDAMIRAVNMTDREAALDTSNRGREELGAFFEQIHAERSLLDDPGNDVIGALIKSRLADGRSLTRDEFIRFSRLVFSAGLDTVTSQLGLAIIYLARNPHKREELVADPSIIASAVEELMRHETLVTEARLVMRDTEIRGVPIKAGDHVMVLLASASRDEDHFPNGEEVDFRRPANRHLNFGAGPHRCLGSHLARLELKVSLEEIHRRMPHYHIDPDVPVVTHTGWVRGVDQLHLIID